MTSAGYRDARGHCVHSVTGKLTNLGEVSDARRVVLPGPARVTTIGEQKAANPLLAAPDEDAFARRLLASLGSYPAYFARLGEVSRRGPALLPGQPGLAPLTPAAVSSLMDQDGWVIDVRPVAGFAAGHIPARSPSRCATRHPGLAAVLVVSLLGLVGTPPTAVFLGKLQVFTAAIDGGYGWLAVLAVANTVASLFHYLRWLAAAFLPQPGEAGAEALEPADRWAAVVAYAAGAASLAVGIAGAATLPLVSGHLIAG